MRDGIQKKRARASTDKPFERVWSILLRVPRGRVVTYGQVSEMIERRLTPVGVGWAIRAAPGELGVPWHRVVNASGGVSTDREHPGLQKELLEREGVCFDDDDRIDLAHFTWKPRVEARYTQLSGGRGGRRRA